MDYTYDWSMAVTAKIQGPGAQGTNLSTFGTGTNSLNLKVQGAPVYNSNWGLYGTTADNLYDATLRFTSNTWRAPTDDSRICFVCTAATRHLQYFLSYETGVYTILLNITVPQTAVDAQTVCPEMTFCKSWTGTPSGIAWSGAAYMCTLKLGF